MFDDIRRIGSKANDVLGVDIFPFNYPFSYTENFLQTLEKWEASIPNKFLWLVNIESTSDFGGSTPGSSRSESMNAIPSFINSFQMQRHEPYNSQPAPAGEVAFFPTRPGESRGKSDNPGWDIDQGKAEITKDRYMKTGEGKQHGVILAQGVVLPGESFQVRDVPISNNMGFIPGKVSGDRSGLQPLVIQFRETNRSFPDLVIRPWIILASHVGLVARDTNDTRNIKCNISVVQLAKTYQYTPLIERKIWRYYNCVPTSIDSKELVYENASNLDLYTTHWHYSHYTIESLPNEDMGEYMSKAGFKRFVFNMADKLLSKNRSYRKLKQKVAKVGRFVDKADKIVKKVDKVLGLLGVGVKTPAGQGDQSRFGRDNQGRFLSD